ncbi:hypothetical protein OROHE_000864 [Orobanche hederae]
MAFANGDQVEVMGVEDGFEHSYFEARVVSISVGTIRVEYATLVRNNGGALRETVDVARVRPYPVDVDVVLEEDDKVDVWASDGWWEGMVIEVRGRSITVYFDYMDDSQKVKVYRREEVRIHHTWTNMGSSPFWVYRRPDTGFHVGQRVEIIGREPGLENSLFPGVVRSVGERTVSVLYTTLRNEDHGELVEELWFRQVRPRPARVDVTLGVGNYVDVWVQDEFWKGRIESDDGDTFTIFFDYMVEGPQSFSYVKRVVRIHQVLQVANNAYYWSYGRLG